MKKILLIVFISGLSLAAFSQDLIVTIYNDSINCRINKVGTNKIYFTYKLEKEIKNTHIRIQDIESYKFDYFSYSEVPSSFGYPLPKGGFETFRLALTGGFSYRTAKVSPDFNSFMQDYLHKLKKGYHLGGDFTYFISEPIGFGLKASLFKTSYSLDNVIFSFEDGTTSIGALSDDISVSFIGPSFTCRLINGFRNNAFLMNFSVGYMGYNNDMVMIQNLKIKGNTIGVCYDLGYDIRLTENLMLGFQLSLIVGLMKEYKLSDGSYTETIKLESGSYEGLGRVDFSIGLRFVK